MTTIDLEDLKKVEIKAEDVIVLSVDAVLSISQIEQFRKALRKVFPKNEIIVLGRDCKLEVYTPEKPL